MIKNTHLKKFTKVNRSMICLVNIGKAVVVSSIEVMKGDMIVSSRNASVYRSQVCRRNM